MPKDIELVIPPIWSRRSGEPGMAYDAFLIYRELGPTRTSTEVARIVSKQSSLIRKWMGKWEWQMRCALWDEKMLARRDEAALGEAAAMGRRQAQLGMQLQEKAKERLGTMQPAELSPQDTIRMATAGAELERTARGEEKGEAGGNIIFNITMKAPPKWAPAGMVKEISKAIEEGAE